MEKQLKKLFLSDEVTVRDVMSSPVIEVNVDDTAKIVAELMTKYKISGIVVKKNGKPVGIVTKRDLIEKVVALDKKPSDVRVSEIMSTPLVTASPDETIEEALRRMNKMGISRLVVTYKDEVHGIISVKDILKVTPDILEIVKEQLRLRGAKVLGSEQYLEGYCDSCGEWSDMLVRVDEQYLCEDCRIELEKRSE
ncbi:MAG: CBS domain-containing protein [Thermoproteota archaeon]